MLSEVETCCLFGLAVLCCLLAWSPFVFSSVDLVLLLRAVRLFMFCGLMCLFSLVVCVLLCLCVSVVLLWLFGV